MAWLFDVWMLTFWIPVLASAGTGWFAIESGLVRSLPIALWFLAALVLQFESAPLSLAWSAGLVGQTVLAIYLSIRLRLET
ncbi:hypothetical protein TBR22_A16220 [Luteitalea sp. TBR-22]|uniref:hypothetical protein n=1 Tax=Luteitalea sp. TBR-22 TaxID=2802971 RepID=UPI001AF6CA80|nr:hypothetical protein [Luteitalea sp. TBR-22]BCS32408.1 hypothetical protein TBR22_A16220 [Luteitalea sp. TBR-22]